MIFGTFVRYYGFATILYRKEPDMELLEFIELYTNASPDVQSQVEYLLTERQPLLECEDRQQNTSQKE